MSDRTAKESHPRDVLQNLGFELLSEGVSLYTPTYKTTTTTPPTDPTLLILCPWAFAQPRHIVKYITPYLTIYPATPILMVENVIRNSIYIPDTWQYPFFQPAAAVVQAHVSSTDRPRVLLHAFSNGGSHAAVQLSETCHETCGGLRLPVDALILDSAPGLPRHRATVRAMVQSVPKGNLVLRGGVTMLTWAMVTTTGVCEMLGVMVPAARKLYRRLADPYDVFVFNGVPKAEKDRKAVPRAYMFSKLDNMILEEDVVAHAQLVMKELEQSGLSTDEVHALVRLEEFVGTPHVNHVKEFADRYWTIVKETWEKSQQM